MAAHGRRASTLTENVIPFVVDSRDVMVKIYAVVFVVVVRVPGDATDETLIREHISSYLGLHTKRAKVVDEETCNEGWSLVTHVCRYVVQFTRKNVEEQETNPNCFRAPKCRSGIPKHGPNTRLRLTEEHQVE